MGLSSSVSKDRKLYGNCQVQSPDGHTMFFCDEKKANWYLNRSLANIIQDSPLIIKLNFTPNGLGNHNKKYGLGEVQNICVVCGTDEHLTRHHVIPYCYRKFLPIEIKSHNFHDVLSLCGNCHEKYERESIKLKMEFAKIYNAPINGEALDNKKLIKIKKIAICLLYTKIPEKKYKTLKREIKVLNSWDRITKKRLINCSKLKIKVYNRTHGEIVVSKLTNIKEFIITWRKHFIENIDCKFLPKNWDIYN